jgi:hypothetical protein
MNPARRPGRLAAWIAIFAILLAALAPSVARALSSPQQQAMPWTDICSVGGPQIAHDVAPASGSGQHEGMGLKHCPFCLTHAGQFALPAATLDFLPTADSRAGVLPPSAAIPPPRFIRATVQPRAPPAIS